MDLEHISIYLHGPLRYIEDKGTSRWCPLEGLCGVLGHVSLTIGLVMSVLSLVMLGFKAKSKVPSEKSTPSGSASSGSPPTIVVHRAWT